VTARAQVAFLLASFRHSRFKVIVATTLAPVLTPITGTWCPNVASGSNATFLESEVGCYAEQKFDGQSDSNLGKVIYCFADFFGPYFYFVMKLIWLFFNFN
jgi:hypothetical protein